MSLILISSSAVRSNPLRDSLNVLLYFSCDVLATYSSLS